jgi:uroporphyrinogen decarboxylase
MLHPMESFQSLEEFERYPYPDPVKDYGWEEIPERVDQLKQQDLVVVAPMATTIFEIAWYLRGMERFMIDMLTAPELASYHMDRITDIRCECARRYAYAGVDILHVGDDVATQLDMMMSPELWRKYLKPRLKKVIDAAREVKEDIIIDYHSDGNVQKIIPDLIEIGVDILNPVQPECMDLVGLKERFGDKLSFRGTIGTQTVMPFGTPEEVDEVCREMIQKVGKGGGFILAPTHVIEPEVPWENIEAMINAVRKYSKL